MIVVCIILWHVKWQSKINILYECHNFIHIKYVLNTKIFWKCFMNSCDSEVFQGFVFSIMWYSKLVDSFGKTLVVFCHCRCESREENLFWEADYYIIAVACSGQSLSMFSCLFVIHHIFYTSWLHIQTYSGRSCFFYFTHRNTEFVIKPLLFLGLWILFFKSFCCLSC